MAVPPLPDLSILSRASPLLAVLIASASGESLGYSVMARKVDHMRIQRNAKFRPLLGALVVATAFTFGGAGTASAEVGDPTGVDCSLWSNGKTSYSACDGKEPNPYRSYRTVALCQYHDLFRGDVETLRYGPYVTPSNISKVSCHDNEKLVHQSTALVM